VLTDAHFHANDLAAVQPDLAGSYRSLGVLGVASVHDPAGLQSSRRAMDGAGAWLVSAGVHPQAPDPELLPFVEGLAESGALAAVGECGFDFFGDRPERVRTPANEATQRCVFEAQLDLATRHSLPIILHLRRANDIVFEYARRLSALPAVVFHSWPGPLNEARALLERCPRSFFSFGASVLNGKRSAAECAALLPVGRVLTESDAPFQPPRVSPQPHAPLARQYSTFADIPAIIARMAGLRDMEPAELENRLYANFTEAFGHAL